MDPVAPPCAWTTQGHAFALCPLSQTNPSVTVCTPTPNSVVSSPAHVVAGTTDSHPVVAVQIYVDNVLLYRVNATSIDTYVRVLSHYKPSSCAEATRGGTVFCG